MSNKSKKQEQFSRVYKRASQSPFNDHSTMLWLASVVDSDDDKLNLNFERYIYVHREIDGSVCGISISKHLLNEHSDFESRYLDGVEMYAFLILHIEEIAAFCELFQDEFKSMFLMPPSDFFAIAEQVWLDEISNI